jgi:serine/threonine-protein kinase
VSTVHTGNTPGTAVGAGDQDLQAGQEVGEYRIESVLGQGGFGTVYAAVHPLIGKRVAIKVLARKYSADPDVVSRFVAEARAVNQIRHRNIIDIFAFGQLTDGRHYYVMEYLEGMPLDLYLKERGPLPLDEALPILRAIARALDAAHAKGIAHRDLKPENIFLAHDTDGEMFPKLLDFGIAKLLAPDDNARHRTGTGVPLGTPYYMSPEQCRGRDVDHRTDIYSFGIVCYRVLTGTFPFEAPDYLELLFKQINEEPPPPSSRNRQLPKTVDAAIALMMQKDPANRPASVLEAVIALDPEGRRTPSLSGVRNPSSLGPAAHGRKSTPDALAATSAPDALAATTAQSVTSHRPRRAGLALLLGLIVLGAGGVAAFLVVRHDASPAASPGPGSASVATVKPSVLPDVPLDAPPAAAPVASADATAAPDHVLVTIEGAPKNTQVMSDGKLIGLAPKVQLPYGTKELALVLQASGYEPAPLSVVPDRDQSVTTKLTRTSRPVVRHHEPNRDDVENPFTKKE